MQNKRGRIWKGARLTHTQSPTCKCSVETVTNVYTSELYKSIHQSRGLMLEGMVVAFLLFHFTYPLRFRSQSLRPKAVFQRHFNSVSHLLLLTSEPIQMCCQGGKLISDLNWYFAKAPNFGIMMTEGRCYCCVISLTLSRRLAKSAAGTRFEARAR